MQPSDIDGKKFTAVRFKEGYDPEQVDTYLEDVKAAWLADRAQMSVTTILPALGAAHPAAVTTFQINSSPPEALFDVQRLMIAAQQAADQQNADATAQAAQIIADAHATADGATAEAEQQRLVLLGGIEEQRQTAQANLDAVNAALATAHSTLAAATTALGGSS